MENESAINKDKNNKVKILNWEEKKWLLIGLGIRMDQMVEENKHNSTQHFSLLSFVVGSRNSHTSQFLHK